MQAKINDRVKVHYKGSLKDGAVFDSSLDRQPLEFTIGAGMVIPGFENGVIGMSEGDKKIISISAEDAYGPRRDDLVIPVARSKIPSDIELKIGMMLQVHSNEGGSANVIVTGLTDEVVTLDMNHPLAGKELVFEVSLIEVSSQ